MGLRTPPYQTRCTSCATAAPRRPCARSVSLALCVWAALGGRGLAHAQYGAAASAERPIAARNAEDATAAGVEVDLENRDIALESMAEVMREVPGARPQVGGAYGAFSALSIRGSQLGHTIWMLGEVPLNTPDSGAFDVSTLPMPLFSSVEVYRGGAPLWYSQGAIGGVVRVVPNRAERTGGSIAIGAGSFGRYDLQGTTQVVTPRVRLHTGIAATQAKNDYPYLYKDVEGSNTSEERHFRNAAITDGSGLIHLEVEAGKGQFDVILLGMERAGGVPGPDGYNTKYTHRRYARALGSVAYTQEHRDASNRRVYRFQLLASTRSERNRFQDPLGEFGRARPADATAAWLRTTLRAAASYSPLPWFEASLTSSYAQDRYDAQDAETPQKPTSVRHTEALGAELRFMGRLRRARAELRGSARLQWSQALLHADIVSRNTELQQRQLSPTFRLAGVLEPVRGLSLRASWATGARVPSILELFGDGGFLKGNAEDLDPEHGQTADLGVVLAGRRGVLAGTLEFNAFVQYVDDIIIWRNTSQYEFVAENRDAALIPGAEVGFNTHVGRHFSLTGQATLLTAEDTQTGTQLPRRPKAMMFARPEVAFFLAEPLTRLSFFGSVDYQSTFFHDAANYSLQPQRTLLSLGTALSGLQGRVTLRVRVTNLLDARTEDFNNYPLPGRGFWAVVTYQEEL